MLPWPAVKMASILLVLLLFTLVSAEQSIGFSAIEESGAVSDDRCVCRVVAKWSELAEYHTLQEMRVKLDDVQGVVHLMNFSAISERLENLTTRCEQLEKHINKQAVATSVTELFALKQKMAMLVNLVHQANSSSFADEKNKIERDLQAVSKVVSEAWSRNPYKQKRDYEKEVAELRARTAKCDEEEDDTPFEGDSLPLSLPSPEGWCPDSASALQLGAPTTHAWTERSQDKKGMWFKDPEPLTNSSRTEIWEVVSNQNYGGYERIVTFTDYAALLRGGSLSSYSNGFGQVRSHPSNPRFNLEGYGAVVYRGSLYYNIGNYIKKMNLRTKVTTSVTIGFQNVNYKGSNSGTKLDFKVDEMGLWVIYSISSDRKIAISHLDPVTLVTQKTWLTGVTKTDICAAFMVCGRMYTLTSCSSRVGRDTSNYVYDTQTSSGQYLQYHLSGMYGGLCQLTYNPRERLLFGWDNGHQVTYRVRWQDA